MCCSPHRTAVHKRWTKPSPFSRRVSSPRHTSTRSSSLTLSTYFRTSSVRYCALSMHSLIADVCSSSTDQSGWTLFHCPQTYSTHFDVPTFHWSVWSRPSSHLDWDSSGRWKTPEWWCQDGNGSTWSSTADFHYASKTRKHRRPTTQRKHQALLSQTASTNWWLGFFATPGSPTSNLLTEWFSWQSIELLQR